MIKMKRTEELNDIMTLTCLISDLGKLRDDLWKSINLTNSNEIVRIAKDTLNDIDLHLDEFSEELSKRLEH